MFDEVQDRHGDLVQLRRAGRWALGQFGIGECTLRLLRHEHNTTFRVDSAQRRFVLRINRSGVHGPETIASEMAWLRALHADTDLGVPEPVMTLDGSPLVLVSPWDGAPPRAAVLLRWQLGRLVDARLTPRHLRQVAVLEAGLQQHAAAWTRPTTFVRPCVDTLTSAAKVRSIGPDTASGLGPSSVDAEAAAALVDELVSTAAAAVIDGALEIVWATSEALAAQPGTAGLVHGDLHPENLLFHRGAARAIDFDDCGWGLYLYDLAVTLWELEGRDRYPELRDALLDEYTRHRSLPANSDLHLKALFLLRRLQILLWILESRDHDAFRHDWRQRASEEIRGIVAAMKPFG